MLLTRPLQCSPQRLSLTANLCASPQGLSNTCCGSMFNSRGYKDAARSKVAELEAALMEASEGGMIPIVFDTSPCLIEARGGMANAALSSAMYEPVQFIRQFLQDKLEFKKVRSG